jgi:hypothetical protein
MDLWEEVWNMKNKTLEQIAQETEIRITRVKTEKELEELKDLEYGQYLQNDIYDAIAGGN